MPCSDPRCSAANHDGDVDSWLAQEDARTEAVIDRQAGWSKASRHDPTPSRPGLPRGPLGFGHHELVVFGLRVNVATSVLNRLGELVRGGAVLSAGDLMSFEAGRTGSRWWRRNTPSGSCSRR